MAGERVGSTELTETGPVDGLPWRLREVGELVEAAVGPRGASGTIRRPRERFDILPLLVCTDGAVTMFGRDLRVLVDLFLGAQGENLSCLCGMLATEAELLDPRVTSAVNEFFAQEWVT